MVGEELRGLDETVGRVVGRLGLSTRAATQNTMSERCQLCGGSGWVIRETGSGPESVECQCVVQARYDHWLSRVREQVGLDLALAYHGLGMLTAPGSKALWLCPDNPQIKNYRPSPAHRRRVTRFYQRINGWATEFARQPEMAYLWGSPGRGKSHAAALVAALFVRMRATPVILYDDVASRVAVVPEARLRESYTRQWKDDDHAVKLRAWEEAPLIIMDDLGGAADYTESFMSFLRQFLEQRLTTMLPTVLTSNLSMAGLMKSGLIGPRLRSRMNLIPKHNRIEFGFWLPDSRPAVAEGE